MKNIAELGFMTNICKMEISHTSEHKMCAAVAIALASLFFLGPIGPVIVICICLLMGRKAKHETAR